MHLIDAHLLDTSAIIYAWDNYPIKQFPKLWEWLGELVKDGDLKIPQVAFEETIKNSPECADWLKDKQVVRVPIGNEILKEALRIKKLLEIEDDQYRKGVGENDIFIIACSRHLKLPLINNEAVQTDLKLTHLANYKIPAVCGLKEVKVPSINFLQFLKESKEVF